MHRRTREEIGRKFQMTGSLSQKGEKTPIEYGDSTPYKGYESITHAEYVRWWRGEK
jgi:hypothetical protein